MKPNQIIARDVETPFLCHMDWDYNPELEPTDPAELTQACSNTCEQNISYNEQVEWLEHDMWGASKVAFPCDKLTAKRSYAPGTSIDWSITYDNGIGERTEYGGSVIVEQSHKLGKCYITMLPIFSYANMLQEQAVELGIDIEGIGEHGVVHKYHQLREAIKLAKEQSK